MAYYNNSNLQPVHAADAWDLDRYMFTAVAYIARAGKKKGSTYEEDVLKALWFLAYSLTKDANYADTVQHVCKGLIPIEENNNAGEETGTANTLFKHDSVTTGAGDVDQYRSSGGIKESQLVSSPSDTGVLEQAYADRVRSWNKGAIE